jgi:ABC-2 type transport system permease protein
MNYRYWLRLATRLWSSEYAHMLEYRAEVILWALSGVLPLIMLGVWSTVIDGQGALPVGGLAMNQPQLARYFLSAFVVRQFTVVWVVWQFEQDCLEGRLSPYLLQPLHPLWRYLATHLAEQATRLPFVILIVSVFFGFQPQAFLMPQTGRLLLAVLAIGLGFAIHFLLQSLVASLCFWAERASALERLLSIPLLFFSGLVAPLDTFPPGARQLALHTPFPWIIGFPAQLLSGAELDIRAGFVAVAVWIALLLPLLLFTWRLGVRRYSAMGA